MSVSMKFSGCTGQPGMFTIGSPPMAPSTTSSSPGWPAAVTDTESPSQLMPSEIHRMLTSCTPEAFSSTAMGHPSRTHLRLGLGLELERVDQQLFAGHDL